MLQAARGAHHSIRHRCIQCPGGRDGRPLVYLIEPMPHDLHIHWSQALNKNMRHGEHPH